jgi:putative salt-induced outer membrane protein
MFRGDWPCIAVVTLTFLAMPVGASATELPPDARELIREAYPKERQTIVNILKRLHPDATEEIDKLVREIDQQKKEKVEQMGLVEGLRGEVAVGGFYSTGNTNEWGVSGTGSIRREGKRWVNSLDLLADIKNEDHHKVTDRLAATYRLRRNFVGSNWFVAGGLSYERDTFAGFSQRFGQFVGAGYQISNNSHLKWDLAAGPGFRQTRFIDAPSENQFGLYARTTLAWQLSDTLKFAENLSAAVGKGNDSYLSTTSVTTDIYGGFALRLSFITELETKPPVDRKKVDTYSRASLVYIFEPH